jgi:hypothetical protein
VRLDSHPGDVNISRDLQDRRAELGGVLSGGLKANDQGDVRQKIPGETVRWGASRGDGSVKLSGLGRSPSVRDEKMSIRVREIDNIAHAATGEIDAVDHFSEFAREANPHGLSVLLRLISLKRSDSRRNTLFLGVRTNNPQSCCHLLVQRLADADLELSSDARRGDETL